MFPTREDESEAIIEHYERKLDLLTQQLVAVTVARDEFSKANHALRVSVQNARDELATVPVQAIALYWDATFVDYGRIAHEDHMKVAKADEAVENWIAEVKYGKRDGWGGTPVTSEYPPDRSMEDADNDRFFEAQ